MKVHNLSSAEWLKAVGVGLAVAILTAVIMFVGLRTGVSPLPKPLGLAFAQTLLGPGVPLPVGLAFHTVWVVFFSVLYVVVFRDALTFARAFWLAFALWVLVLVFFFPVVGWGFLGLAVSPKLIVASAVPHLLFALFLWALAHWSFSSAGERETRSAAAR